MLSKSTSSPLELEPLPPNADLPSTDTNKMLAADNMPSRGKRKRDQIVRVEKALGEKLVRTTAVTDPSSDARRAELATLAAAINAQPDAVYRLNFATIMLACVVNAHGWYHRLAPDAGRVLPLDFDTTHYSTVVIASFAVDNLAKATIFVSILVIDRPSGALIRHTVPLNDLLTAICPGADGLVLDVLKVERLMCTYLGQVRERGVQGLPLVHRPGPGSVVHVVEEPFTMGFANDDAVVWEWSRDTLWGTSALLDQSAAARHIEWSATSFNQPSAVVAPVDKLLLSINNYYPPELAQFGQSLIMRTAVSWWVQATGHSIQGLAPTDVERISKSISLFLVADRCLDSLVPVPMPPSPRSPLLFLSVQLRVAFCSFYTPTTPMQALIAAKDGYVEVPFMHLMNQVRLYVEQLANRGYACEYEDDLWVYKIAPVLVKSGSHLHSAGCSRVCAATQGGVVDAPK